jgi:hypothetical protein
MILMPGSKVSRPSGPILKDYVGATATLNSERQSLERRFGHLRSALFAVSGVIIEGRARTDIAATRDWDQAAAVRFYRVEKCNER